MHADLVLFMDSGRRADPRIQADFEDAVDFLTKRKVPIIFTQRFHERHTEVQQWLRDLQLTTASGRLALVVVLEIKWEGAALEQLGTAMLFPCASVSNSKRRH